MSSESVIPCNHLILCHPLLLLPTVFPTIRVFSSELALHIKWLKYWSFSFSISPSYEYSGMISFRIDWFDLLVIQGPLKSLLLHHSSNTWILLSLTFVMVQLSNPYMTTVHVHLYIHTWLHIPLTPQNFVDKVMSLLANMLSRFITAFFFFKEQESFSLMAVVAVHSDFGAQENKVSQCLHFFPHLFAMKWWDLIPWSYFLNVDFHSPLWPHREALYFLLAFCHYSVVICISEIIDISPGNLDSSFSFSWLSFCMI